MMPVYLASIKLGSSIIFILPYAFLIMMLTSFFTLTFPASRRPKPDCMVKMMKEEVRIQVASSQVTSGSVAVVLRAMLGQFWTFHPERVAAIRTEITDRTHPT